MRKFKRGDIEAFESLVRKHQDRIFRLASLSLFDTELSADVTQEVFIRSFKGLPAFRFGSSVYTWLYRTTKNVCHEFNRRRKTETLDFEPIDYSNEPESSVARAQLLSQMRTNIVGLPERQRDVVILRVLEGFSVRETAAIMRCRQGTVKALLHKAKNSLKSDQEIANE